MKIRKYEQSTFETCLSVDLLQFIGTKISQKKELEILDYAIKFSKHNFTIGHLDFIAKKFNLKLDFYVDNKKFLNFIKKIEFSRNINIMWEKVDLKLIDKLVKKSPIIVYLDSFYLWRVHHYPHFIIVLERIKNKYKIFDPWNGGINTINSRLLSKSIVALRNSLKFCPQIIQIDK